MLTVVVAFFLTTPSVAADLEVPHQLAVGQGVAHSSFLGSNPAGVTYGQGWKLVLGTTVPFSSSSSMSFIGGANYGSSGFGISLLGGYRPSSVTTSGPSGFGTLILGTRLGSKLGFGVGTSLASQTGLSSIVPAFLILPESPFRIGLGAQWNKSTYKTGLLGGLAFDVSRSLIAAFDVSSPDFEDYTLSPGFGFLFPSSMMLSISFGIGIDGQSSDSYSSGSGASFNGFNISFSIPLGKKQSNVGGSYISFATSSFSSLTIAAAITL